MYSSNNAICVDYGKVGTKITEKTFQLNLFVAHCVYADPDSPSIFSIYYSILPLSLIFQDLLVKNPGDMQSGLERLGKSLVLFPQKSLLPFSITGKP